MLDSFPIEFPTVQETTELSSQYALDLDAIALQNQNESDECMCFILLALFVRFPRYD